jgi:hypothetical protein
MFGTPKKHAPRMAISKKPGLQPPQEPWEYLFRNRPPIFQPHQDLDPLSFYIYFAENLVVELTWQPLKPDPSGGGTPK